MDKKLKVCTIGGGSGMPTVNRALVMAGFEDIHSIVTTFDSGGDSGRMRTDERGGVLAFSDYWRSLLSLWQDGEQKENWQEMLKFRDGRGRNFGNLFFQFMAEKQGNLSKVDRQFSKLTGAEIRGEVVPVSTEPANLCFETVSGKMYIGENYLDELRMSRDVVKRVWLSPSVHASDEALQSLKEADVIIVCPGSMYGSVITNFLVEEMSSTFVQSKAKKILMTNIMSVANENHGFCQDDYVEKFGEYLGTKSPFDLVLMADLGVLKQDELEKVMGLYEYENSFAIKINEKSVHNTALKDMAIIEEKNSRLRHSAHKMAQVFSTLEI